MEAVSQHILDFITVPAIENFSVTEWSNGDGCGSGEGCGQACGGYAMDGIGLTRKEGSTDSLKSLVSYCGKAVYHLEGIPCILYVVVGNAAYGAVIMQDMTLRKGIIAKYGSSFAFAEHAKDAYQLAKELSIKKGWEHYEKDPQAFMLANYPDPDAPIDRRQLFELHNVLTGSCISGREEYIKDNNISVEGTMTLREFFELCKYTYGRDTLVKIAAAYNINI